MCASYHDWIGLGNMLRFGCKTSMVTSHEPELSNGAVKLAINNYRSRRYHRQWRKYFYELSKYVHDTWTETIKKESRVKEQGKYFYVVFFWALNTNSIKDIGWVGEGGPTRSISRAKETIKMPMEIWSFFKQLPSYPSSLKAVGSESDKHETLRMFIASRWIWYGMAYHEVEWRSILSRKFYAWMLVWWPRQELKQILSRNRHKTSPKN